MISGYRCRMSDFYYLRHGATLAEWDIELSEAGKIQAVQGAEITQRCVESLKTICTSPLLRARQTANEVRLRFPEADLREIAGLREWDFGQWSRAPYKDFKEQYLSFGNPPGGETHQAFADRVRVALEKCLSLPGPLLIVAHGGVWMMIYQSLSLTLVDVPHAVPVHVYQKQGGKWDLRILDKSDS